jgi:hypothetical protein
MASSAIDLLGFDPHADFASATTPCGPIPFRQDSPRMRSLITISAFALALAACTTSPASPAGSSRVADGASVQLAPGQSATLADESRLGYVKLAGDSRCRSDVQCVWAGDATIAMRWTPASGAARDFELHTTLDPKSFDAGMRTITLQALERGDAPKATLRVDSKP